MLDYGALSLLPSFIAIGVAIAFRQVYLSLFLGVWSGAWLLAGGDAEALLSSFFRTLDTYIVQALVPENGSPSHIVVVVFTLCIGGMIGVISRNGGLQAIVHSLSRYATTPQRAEWMTYGFGGLLFFDGYANTLIVGNSMRSITEKLGVRREKLAYIVDSTSSPLACIAVVTTWIGFQISLIRETLGEGAPAFDMILGSITYNFYPILALIFVAIVIGTKRDFGPMHSEKNNVQMYKNENEEEANNPLKHNSYLLAVIPIATLISGVFIGLLLTGKGNALHEIFGSADSFKAMLWASFASLVMAIVLSVAFGRMSIPKVIGAMEEGMQPMFGAVIVLVFAWALADINTQLGAASVIASWFDNSSISASWIPIVIFILAAFCSFATGTSWGTMGIMMPLALPLAVGAVNANGAVAMYEHQVILATLAAVMGGSAWGDHCSPISDTTILSSIASGCEHSLHVRTQLPYALLVSVIAVTVGMIPVLVLNIPLIVSFVLCVITLYLVMRIFGEL